MDQKDIRWIQRFTNYRKALAKLEETVKGRKLEELTELEKEGLIQRFEYTYELAWKTLQDFLRFRGYTEIAGPTPALQQALRDGYLEDENKWRLLKKSREATAHTYNSGVAETIAQDIYQLYYSLMKQLEKRLEEERSSSQGSIFES